LVAQKPSGPEYESVGQHYVEDGAIKMLYTGKLDRALKAQGWPEDFGPGHTQCGHNIEGNNRLVFHDQNSAALQQLIGRYFHRYIWKPLHFSVNPVLPVNVPRKRNSLVLERTSAGFSVLRRLGRVTVPKLSSSTGLAPRRGQRPMNKCFPRSGARISIVGTLSTNSNGYRRQSRDGRWRSISLAPLHPALQTPAKKRLSIVLDGWQTHEMRAGPS
jgi:hypothetical protein